MALLTYAEVRPWAQAIKEEVHERRMPPWGAMKGFGEFAGDNSLTAEEIHLLADWVEGGAPEGDAQYLPPVPPLRAAGKRTQAGTKGMFSDGQRLTSAFRLASIAPPKGLEEGASFQAVAVLQGGETVPLLWLYNFRPKLARTFQYVQPVRLPAGAVIKIRGAGKVRVWH